MSDSFFDNKEWSVRLSRIASWPIWAKLNRYYAPIARAFEGPRFHRFEWFFMRLLLAYVIYQSMPLGGAFSNAVTPSPSLDAALRKPLDPLLGLAAESGENSSRTVVFLLPLSELAPNSQASLTYKTQEKPVGLAKFLDLTFFSDPGFQRALPWIVFPCLLLYVSGLGLPVALPILALISVCSRTFFNSQGSINHGYQMLSLVLVAQSAVVLWHAIRHDWRAAFGLRPARRIGNFTLWDRTIRYSQWMIVICYVIAGVIKPIKSDGAWFQNSHYIGIQVVKTHRQNFYSNLEEKWNIPEPRMAAVMLKEHPDLIRLFLSCGVLLEIFAFLALANRFCSLLFGLALVGFHCLNDLMMGLYFYGNEKLDWIFLVNLPFWLWWIGRRFRRPLPQEQEVGEAEPAAA